MHNCCAVLFHLTIHYKPRLKIEREGEEDIESVREIKGEGERERGREIEREKERNEWKIVEEFTRCLISIIFS